MVSSLKGTKAHWSVHLDTPGIEPLLNFWQVSTGLAWPGVSALYSSAVGESFPPHSLTLAVNSSALLFSASPNEGALAASLTGTESLVLLQPWLQAAGWRSGVLLGYSNRDELCVCGRGRGKVPRMEGTRTRAHRWTQGSCCDHTEQGGMGVFDAKGRGDI